jgi:hypothetical protein
MADEATKEFPVYFKPTALRKEENNWKIMLISKSYKTNSKSVNKN